jgi:hypothetical protein
MPSICWQHSKTAGTFSSTPTIWRCYRRWSTKSRSSAVDLDYEEDPMSTDLLRASEAARRLDMSTRDLVRLVYERKIRDEMVDGIAHIPGDALEEYRGKAS